MYITIYMYIYMHTCTRVYIYNIPIEYVLILCMVWCLRRGWQGFFNWRHAFCYRSSLEHKCIGLFILQYFIPNWRTEHWVFSIYLDGKSRVVSCGEKEGCILRGKRGLYLEGKRRVELPRRDEWFWSISLQQNISNLIM